MSFEFWINQISNNQNKHPILSFNRILSYSLFLLLFISIASCKASKKSKTGKDYSVMTAENISNILDQNQIRPDWFSAKAQINFNDGRQKIGFTSTIISKKDEAFWMNGKKFGFEAGRVMFKSDSLYILDRLNKKYFKDNNTSLAQRYALPDAFIKELSVRNLQDIFMGNSLHNIIPYTELNTLEDHYLLSGTKEEVKSTLLLRKVDFVPTQATFKQGDIEVNIEYKDHKIFNESLFSYNRIIQMTAPGQQVNLDLKYLNIDMETPKEILFSIPSRYSEMNF